jgi:hypothetical protein
VCYCGYTSAVSHIFLYVNIGSRVTTLPWECLKVILTNRRHAPSTTGRQRVENQHASSQQVIGYLPRFQCLLSTLRRALPSCRRHAFSALQYSALPSLIHPWACCPSLPASSSSISVTIPVFPAIISLHLRAVSLPLSS